LSRGELATPLLGILLRRARQSPEAVKAFPDVAGRRDLDCRMAALDLEAEEVKEAAVQVLQHVGATSALETAYLDSSEAGARRDTPHRSGLWLVLCATPTRRFASAHSLRFATWSAV
jgi:hypothetical protein